jgi:hypothetical protein
MPFLKAVAKIPKGNLLRAFGQKGNFDVVDPRLYLWNGRLANLLVFPDFITLSLSGKN